MGNSVTVSATSPVNGVVAQREKKQNEDVGVETAKSYLSEVLHLEKGQNVLVIYDDYGAEVADIFINAAKDAGANVDTYKLKSCRFKEGGLAEMMSLVRSGKYQVFCNFIEGRAEETPSRVELIVKGQMKTQARTAHSPGITKSMMELKIDYVAMKRTEENLMKSLAGAKKVAITAPSGTNIEINFNPERVWVSELNMEPAGIGNFPCGEIFIAPSEYEANGTIVCDGSIGNFGLVPSPLVIEVKNGKAVELKWKDPNYKNDKLLKDIKDFLNVDAMASIIGELGIGMAPYELIGNLLQDEKAARTIHIAFGNNEEEGNKGGINTSKNHLDFLVKNPRVVVHYIDPIQAPKIIIDNGEFLLK